MLMEYESLTPKGLLSVELTILQTVACGIPNCKEVRLVDFCGLRENACWIIFL
jgi:hypothetical protein